MIFIRNYVYMRYTNVGMCEKFHPIVGDIGEWFEMQKQNKFRFQYIIEIGKKKKWDLYILHQGPSMLVHVTSPKALKEVERMIPEFIDRDDNRDFLAGRVVPGSFAILPSNK